MDKEIMKFLNECSDMAGKYEAENYSQFTFCTIKDQNITSPIEQYLFIALRTVATLNVLDKKITITPQFPCENYRADFMVSCGDRSVIVECDSQEFHDRTEQERRYEKMRERCFVMAGYKVMHYTGKEILQQPFKTAAEIIGFVSNQPSNELFDWVQEYGEHA